MSPNWLDLAVVVLVAAGAFRGFRRGMVREGMAFGGLAVGLILASEWNSEVADLLRPFVGGGGLPHALAYLLVVLAVLGFATLLTVLTLRLMRLLLVGWLDRLGGIVFGAGQGAILAALLLILMVRFPILGLDRAVKDSLLATGLLDGLPAALAYLPPQLGAVADLFDPGSLP